MLLNGQMKISVFAQDEIKSNTKRPRYIVFNTNSADGRVQSISGKSLPSNFKISLAMIRCITVSILKLLVSWHYINFSIIY